MMVAACSLVMHVWLLWLFEFSWLALWVWRLVVGLVVSGWVWVFVPGYGLCVLVLGCL